MKYRCCNMWFRIWSAVGTHQQRSCYSRRMLHCRLKWVTRLRRI